MSGFPTENKERRKHMSHGNGQQLSGITVNNIRPGPIDI
jgi:hypothetical protein